MKRVIKIFPLLTAIFALASGSLYPQNPGTEPGKSSLPAITANLQKEIVDVAEKLTNTQIALQEAQNELADVKKIATGIMDEPLPEDGETVTAEHLEAIAKAKEHAIDLFATPQGASLEKFHDRFDKAEKALQEARTNLGPLVTIDVLTQEEPEAPEVEEPKEEPVVEVEEIEEGEEVEEDLDEVEEIPEQEVLDRGTEPAPVEVVGEEMGESSDLDREPPPAEVVDEEPEESSESAMMDILG
jgi:hypothetical protein